MILFALVLVSVALAADQPPVVLTISYPLQICFNEGENVLTKFKSSNDVQGEGSPATWDLTTESFQSTIPQVTTMTSTCVNPTFVPLFQSYECQYQFNYPAGVAEVQIDSSIQASRAKGSAGVGRDLYSAAQRTHVYLKPRLVIVGTSINCAGLGTITFKVVASSLLTLNYNWQLGGQSGITAANVNVVVSGLAPGNYVASATSLVEDCSPPSASAEIVALAPIATTAVQAAAVRCDAGGSVTVTGSGRDYFCFSKNANEANPTWICPDPHTKSYVFDGLAAGHYYFNVKGPDQCLGNVVDIILAAPVQPTFHMVVTQPDCITPTGSIKIIVDSGDAPYEYSINGGVTWSSSDTFTGIAPGSSRTVLVRSSVSRCMSESKIATFKLLIQPTFHMVVTQPDCNSPTGSIKVIADLGEAPFEYSINGGSTWVASDLFTGLAPGSSASVLVRSTISHCVSAAQSVVFKALVKPTFHLVVTQPDCNAPTGSIKIIVDSGEAPYEYSINGGLSWVASDTFSGLAPGSGYSVMVRSTSSFCVSEAKSVSLKALVHPTFHLEVMQPDCSVPAGSIKIIVDSGEGPFQYSINGGVTWVASDMFTGLAPGSSYSVMVRSTVSFCVSAAQGVVFKQLVNPTFHMNVTQPDCNSPTGSIKIIAELGEAPFEYSINGGATWVASDLFTGLAPGSSASVLVRSTVSHCVSQAQSVVFNMLIHPTFHLIVTQPDCNSPAGSIKIVVDSGDAPYQYSINGGATWVASDMFGGLAPGSSHSVMVRSTLSFCVSEAQAVVFKALVNPTFHVNVTQPNCNAPGGSIKIVVDSGEGPFQYSINGGITWVASDLFSGLAPGSSYSVMVRSTVSFCVSEAKSVVFKQLVNPTFHMAVTQPDCNSPTGSIKIIADLGEGPFEYSINGGLSWVASDLFSGLAPGSSYNVMVRSTVSFCVSQGQSVVFKALVNPTFHLVVSQPDCNSPTGSIRIFVDAGEAPFEYSINGGASWGASDTFSGLAPGSSHSVMVRSTVSFCVSAAQNVVFKALVNPTFHLVLTQPDCNSPGGIIRIVVDSGEGPFEYSINGGATWVASDTFAGLAAGSSHSVMVRSTVSFCVSAAQSVVFNVLVNPTFHLNITQPNCNTPTGSIKIIADLGDAPFEYSINGGLTWVASDLFSGLAPGSSHSVMVRSTVSFCVSQAQSVMFTELIQPTFHLVVSQPDCNAPTGSIKIIADSGAAPFEYSINGGATWSASDLFSGLAAGSSHSVMVRSTVSFCVSAAQNVVLKALVNPTFHLVLTQPDCNIPSGSIKIIADLGEGPFEYSINGGATWVASDLFIGLAPGSSHSVLVRSTISHCVSEAQSVVFKALVNPTFHMVVTQPDCNAPTGSIKIIVDSGEAPYEYSINGGITWQASDMFSGLAPGSSYNVMVRSTVSFCVSLSQGVSLKALVNPAFNTIVTQPDCNTPTGSIKVIATQGEAPFEYSINGGATWQASDLFTGLAPGSSYDVLVRSTVSHCVSASEHLVMNVLVHPTFTLIIAQPNCVSPLGSIQVVADLGAAPFEYSFNNGATWQSEAMLSGLAPGSSYDVLVRSSVSHCVSAPEHVMMSELVPPEITLNINEPTCDTPGSITVNAFGDSPAFQFSINGGESFGGSGNSYTFTNLQPGSNYSIVVSAGVCESEILSGTLDVCIPDLCAKSQGFWKNHPDIWADCTACQDWCGHSFSYYLNTPPQGDALIIAGKQYAAFVLNFQYFNTHQNVRLFTSVSDFPGGFPQAWAQAFLALNGAGGCTLPRNTMLSYAGMLEEFNSHSNPAYPWLIECNLEQISCPRAVPARSRTARAQPVRTRPSKINPIEAAVVEKARAAQEHPVIAQLLIEKTKL